MKRAALFFGFALILLCIAGCKTSPDEGRRIAPEIGAIAPGFTLTSLEGESVSLTDHRGKVVLINFWATWCPPCRQEMPGIQSRFEIHQPDLVVLAVDNDEPASLVQDFVDFAALTFDPLLDPGGQVQQLYQIRSFPTSMFVDENGVIKIVHIGLMSEAQLDIYLAQMGLEEQTALD